MSGHSKFANIKHKKEKNDAKKGKIFTVIGRELVMAVKAGGFTDGVKGFVQGFIEAHGFSPRPGIPLCPSRAGGGTGSVSVSGTQTSTDVTKHPDALRRQEHV